jgi:small conductance mechanosensitive channel
LRPFRVGDEVVVAGAAGRVTEMELLVTRIDTADNRQIVVPNGTIVRANIENLTRHRQRRVDVPVQLSGHVDVGEGRTAFEALLVGVDGVLSTPAPVVELLAVGAMTSWELRAWCATEDYARVRQRVLEGAQRVVRTYPVPKE